MAEAQLTNQFTRIDTMTNAELKAELKKRGCSTSGNKKDLIAKLRTALERDFGQSSVDVSSTPSMLDPMHSDGRRSQTHVHQSPVASVDGNRSFLNNSVASSSNYMTPTSGSPMVHAPTMQTGEVSMAYNNSSAQYSSNSDKNIHQSATPTIPVPQHLTINTPERNQLQYMASPIASQQSTPMKTRQTRSSHDASLNTSASSVVATPSPEKRTRTRGKKPSIDSQPIVQEPTEQVEVQPKPIPKPVEEVQPEQPIVPPIVQEEPAQENTIVDAPSNINNENNLEVNSFVSKSNEDDQKDLGEERGERGESRSPSVGSSSAKSESVIKEIPLSGDRHRLSRSKSPKSRWHHSPSPREPEHQTNQVTTIEEENGSASKTNDGDEKNSDKPIEEPSHEKKTAEEKEINSNEHEDKKVDAAPETTNDQQIASTEDSKTNESQPSETTSSAQQEPKKRIHTQTSGSSSSSSSLMKGINRSATNRMNLSCDVLKTLIPDISLAPESVIETELESTNVESNNEDRVDESSSQTGLETNVRNATITNDLTVVHESTEQKQRNRTVVIDLAIDSSSINDDLVGNGVEMKKKTSTGQVPVRMASFESKLLVDGKKSALMTDEPFRVRDANAAREPPTRIVYIRGLTRPFTPSQLKELLARYGTLTEGELWFDKIKSQCFAVYETSEDAAKAREALDGCRWPSSNPKILTVDFGRQEEYDFSKTHNLPPDQLSADSNTNIVDRQVTEKQNKATKQTGATRRSASPSDDLKQNNKKTRPAASGDVREWDLPKLRVDKDTTGNERHVIEESSEKNKTTPSKGLDDYFRKTKAKPAIYWLPLTEEQAIEKAQQKQKRKAEQEEQRKRESEQHNRESNNSKDFKSRSNNNGTHSSHSNSRRSVSPKDKRKRVSSSPSSPPRRDNKRH